MALPRLSPAQEATLREQISSAIRDLRSRSSRTPTAAEIEYMAEEVRAYVSRVVSSELFEVNSFEAPFCGLPDEVISLIAHHLDFKAVLVASRICSRWRKAVVNDPKLWQRIILRRKHQPVWNSGALGELLSRSQQLPVLVSYSDAYDVSRQDRPVRVPKHIAKHLHHIHSLSIRFARQGLTVQNLTRPAPILTSLTLETIMIRSIDHRLPNNLLSGRAPLLTVVSLRGFALPMAHIEFPSVKLLHFCRPPEIHVNSVPDWYPLRRIAQVFPNISRLVLGQRTIEFDERAMDDVLRQRGFVELIVNDSLISLYYVCDGIMNVRAIPRIELDTADTFGSMQEYFPDLETMHFFQNSVEGISPEGRIINARFGSHEVRLQPFEEHFQHIRSAVFAFDQLQYSFTMPLLQSMEVEILDTSVDSFRRVFDWSGNVRAWVLPALRTLHLRFVSDQRGAGRRTIPVSALVSLVRNFCDIGPPKLQKLDVVNLRITLDAPSSNLLALVDQVCMDGVACDHRLFGARAIDGESDDAMPLIPPEFKRSRSHVGESNIPPHSNEAHDGKSVDESEREGSGHDGRGHASSARDGDGAGADEAATHSSQGPASLHQAIRSLDDEDGSYAGEDAEDCALGDPDVDGSSASYDLEDNASASIDDNESVDSDDSHESEGCLTHDEGWRLLSSEFPAVPFRDLIL